MFSENEVRVTRPWSDLTGVKLVLDKYLPTERSRVERVDYLWLTISPKRRIVGEIHIGYKESMMAKWEERFDRQPVVGRLGALVVHGVMIDRTIEEMLGNKKTLQSIKRRIRYTRNKIREFEERLRTGVHVGSHGYRSELQPRHRKWTTTKILTLTRRLGYWEAIRGEIEQYLERISGI